jgi:hypothetical protein
MFTSTVRLARNGLSRVAMLMTLIVTLVIAGPASPSQADATGSVYFPDNSYSTMSPGITFGGQTTPFTIETWFKTDYSDTGGEGIVILGSAPNPAGFKGLSLYAVPGRFDQWVLDSDGFANVAFTFAQTPAANTWHYLAASRDSTGYIQVWVNGVASSTGRKNISNINTDLDFIGPTTRVGAWTNNNRYNDGTFISNLRITNTNLYDTTLGTIAVPTSPFTAVAGTKLLMNSGSITDSTGQQTFSTAGTAAASSQNPFFGVATVTNISPSSGPSQGGTPVTITGTNLLNASSVTVGGVAATIVSTSGTSIDILTPAGSVGTQSVVVTGAAGTPTTTYTYQVVNLPGTPTLVSATSGGTQSSVVTWTAPGSTGGSAITEYQVLSSGGQTCTSATTSCTISGLSEGASYTFTVRAKNILGFGAYSTPSAVATTASAHSSDLASTGTQTARSMFVGGLAVLIIALGSTLVSLRRVKLTQQ